MGKTWSLLKKLKIGWERSTFTKPERSSKMPQQYTCRSFMDEERGVSQFCLRETNSGKASEKRAHMTGV